MDLKCLVYLFAVFSLIQSDSDQKDPDRIIGGKLCKLKQFPYVVALYINPNMVGLKGKLCTGSIIASKWVITAAHCYRNIIDKGGDIKKLVTTVIAGTVDYADENEASQERTSVRHIVHELNPNRPRNETGNFDIALVEVDQPFNFNVFVDKISMAKFPRRGRNLPCSSVGFGYTTPTPPFNNTRMFYIKTTTTDFMFCKKSIWNFALRAEHLCVDPVKEGTETAPGDSGGPLVYGRFHVGVLIGIMPLNDYDFYQFYTKVSYFEDWIRKHVPKIPPMKTLKVIKPRSEKRSSASSATVAGVSVLTIAFWLSILVGSDRTSAKTTLRD